MKRITKKALGLVGLATVAALTVVAAGINNPASAVTSGDVTLKYLVLDEGKTNVVVEAPTNGEVTVDNVIPISVIYGATSTIKYSLTYNGPDGQPITIELPEYQTEVYEGGIHNWNLNLSDYDLGYGTYILHVDVFGNGTASDSVEFTYQAAKFEPVPDSGTTLDENGNVVPSDDGDLSIKIEASSEVDHMQLNLLNSDKTPYIDPITGQPVVVYVSSEDIARGQVTIHLADYGLSNNTLYYLRADVYDINNALIDSFYIPIMYRVADVDVPNTGGSILAALNLSNSDFLISALIAFGAVTIVAFILMKKSSRR